MECSVKTGVKDQKSWVKKTDIWKIYLFKIRLVYKNSMGFLHSYSILIIFFIFLQMHHAFPSKTLSKPL